MYVYVRRHVGVHKSLDAMINRCLGSGANGVGYYMYHGGATPKGNLAYFSDEAYGLPKISYNFQALIGEFGQVREGFHRLKLLHFLFRISVMCLRRCKPWRSLRKNREIITK